MIRLTSFFIALIFLIASCNNESVTNTQAPSKEEQMKNLITQYPDSLLLKENLIQYYRENYLYDQAITETDKAITKDSLSDRLWDIKAFLFLEKGDTLNSIQAFEKAVAIAPDPKYIMSLGCLYAQTKNPQALAVADGLMAIPQAQAQTQALFIKGLFYSSTGDKLRAIDIFSKCISQDYTNMLPYKEKAICLYDLGRYEDALIVLEKATTVKSTYDEGYYWAGRCFEKLHNIKEAIASYQLALQIDPEYEEAQDALSKLGIK